MHVLITNDDGPLHDQFSPYIRPFIQYILSTYPEWQITVCVPHTQKSWIGKAHLAGKNLVAQFLYSNLNSNDNKFWGPFNQPQLKSRSTSRNDEFPYINNPEIPKNAIEWILLDGTPASCVNIGLHYLSKTEFDLVISGPNVGRNTSAAYITSSGTVGAAMESIICNDTKAVALSWAYFDGRKIVPLELMRMASKRSMDIVNFLLKNWDDETDLYSINVPLVDSLNGMTKVRYAPVWENRWCAIFDGPEVNLPRHDEDVEAGEEYNTISFKWNPNFKGHNDSKRCSKDDPIHDMGTIEERAISVTPLRATFKGLDHLIGELNIIEQNTNENDTVVAITIDPSEYIHNPLMNAIKKYLPNVKIVNELPSSNERKKIKRLFQYGDYEQLDVDRLLLSDGKFYFANSYIYRKALIRKHYLSHTIQTYTVKHPDSILKRAFPESYTIDLDYAEFLDDSLDENWELRQELERENRWWIVKPSMSDKGQGIRVFKTIDDLQAIFDSFDDEEEDEDQDDGNDAGLIDDNKIIISQLRHFIIQEYMSNPLLLPSMDNKKFHIRCYITCKGDLEVFVYDRMLALFAPTSYTSLEDNEYSVTNLNNLQCHLTNTCLQTKNENKDLSVMEFDKLSDISDVNKKQIKEQIHEITHDLFLAAINANRLNFQPLKNAFETYGVDFLVDSNYNVKLLEINAYPDFKQTGQELKGLIDELFDNIVSKCIYPFLSDDQEEKLQKQSLNESGNLVQVLEHTSNDW
ncbi:putative tubulin tyrosine ligase NDAI_0A07760 [Naumovozyma dairenensis CBS 421]|uniref:Survival protein SurE-like phosphatase/nucleotidase domain-containing protein n=1 Tax=Naumovozyma dairenensis (strain ATCC 10597 / BCRC 20456 / CBS 421 / NBRC 0211 / NRRL Y-12639) TaxID=1071378 RepID=G0W542_NAUDC|nr:hypothetical protein NDAI_0A07760 [Naumovozyma dairenensis CBS 421]CCD22930.1 hypothetical protein NDAI_0A07760 [Naumovozyma dairenensis CBS 421]